HKGRTYRMQREENRRPEEVEAELEPPDRHGPTRMSSVPRTPAGDGDHDVKDGPNRCENPVGRVERRLLQSLVPCAGRSCRSDQHTTANHEDKEQSERDDARHDRRPIVSSWVNGRTSFALRAYRYIG